MYVHISVSVVPKANRWQHDNVVEFGMQLKRTMLCINVRDWWQSGG